MAHTRAMVNQQRLTSRQHFMCSEGWLSALPLSQLRSPGCNGNTEEAITYYQFHDIIIIHMYVPYKPLTFMHITQARTPTKTASAITIKHRCIQMQNIREVVSQEESSALLQRVLDYLSTSDRQILWQEAGNISAIGLGEALAIKAGLGMPWSKLRVVRR